MSVTRTVAKNTFFNFVTTACDVLINLAIGILLARSLGADQYGTYSFLMWFITLGALVANLGLGEMAKRFVAEAQGHQDVNGPRNLVRMTLVLRGLAALAVALVIMAFAAFWSKEFNQQGNQLYFILVGASLLPNVLNNVLMSIFAGFQKYEYGAYMLLGSNPIRAVLIVVFIAMGFGVREVLIVNIAAWALGTFIGVFLLHRLVPLKHLLASSTMEPVARRAALKYALTLAVIFILSYIVWDQAETLLVGHYCSADQVGFYRLGSNMPYMLMQLIPAVLGAVLLPAVSEQFGRGDMEKIRMIFTTSSRYLMMISLPLAVGGIVLARPFIIALYGAQYEPAVVIMQIIFIPYMAMGVANAATSVIYGINEPSFILKVYLMTACLSIGLNLWLIPKYGIVGAAIGSSGPRFLSALLYIHFASRKIAAPWPLSSTAKIALASLVMGLPLLLLQYHLGTVASLVLSLPLGVMLYLAAILVLREVHKLDLEAFKKIQDYLPVLLRGKYAALLNVAGRLLE